ncbi:MAG: calcium/sodium antiporter [Bacteroidales bacterium]|jgi:cation:H+ antiporter|nr:calcium/sodium antiporter [Bacteroidales bacterium]
MLPYLLLILGFVVLIFGADYLVKGASSIAKKLKISDLIIGLTVVSFGTSAPELAVNIMASSGGSPGMAIGNVVGSNIFNLLVIVGLAAMLRPISLQRSLVKIEIPYAILAAFVLIAVAGDEFLGEGTGMISRADGIVLLLFFAIFLYYIFLSARNGQISPDDAPKEEKVYPVLLSVLFVTGGLAALIFGGDLIVDNATKLALGWGMSETVIGLTIVAAGTSLPELATSLMAAYRGNSEIAIGNVVGSNIFNIFLILGISASITPLPFAMANMTDVVISAAATMLVLALAFRGKGTMIDKREGALLFLLYIGYVTWLLTAS